MKRIDIGQTITILANVGVLAGIALLAVELRQNTKLLRAHLTTSRSVGIFREEVAARLRNKTFRSYDLNV
jgi:hypothetical protein